MIIIYQTTQKMKQKAICKMKRMEELKKQRGMTLLEIIIVLGIIGTIAAGVVILAQRAFDNRTISDMVSNTNTVRIAVKDAYQRAASYAVSDGAAVLALNNDSIRTHTANQPIVADLVQLGKLSIDEARNGVSNDFINIGGAKTAATQPSPKGFVVELNGLSRDQCRSMVSQVGNQWDYVQVATGASAGSYTVAAVVDMSAATATSSPTGILRSLEKDGNKNITPAEVNQVCEDTSSNSVILGSR